MKIDLVKLVEEVYKLEGEPKNVNKVFALICLQAFKEQLTLTDVVVPKGTLVCDNCETKLKAQYHTPKGIFCIKCKD